MTFSIDWLWFFALTIDLFHRLTLDSVSSFETPKLVNWHILHRGFFKGIFKGSSHAYPTSSLHRVSALSLREGVRDILDILAQCNRPNPTLAYTSILGFSHLYILILGFIVTHTGYCTTLLHNKDVALKRFLCGCRPTRLNHVTFIFSMFLFYASSSTSNLAYTTWFNTLC